MAHRDGETARVPSRVLDNPSHREVHSEDVPTHLERRIRLDTLRPETLNPRDDSTESAVVLRSESTTSLLRVTDNPSVTTIKEG